MRGRYLFSILSLGFIAYWTLLPSADRQPEPFSACLLCGSRGAADAILNLVLFVPFGMAISWRGGWRFALAAGFLVSAFIEVCQTRIPGREPTTGDLLFNSLGALCGYLLATTQPRWSRALRSNVVPTLVAAGFAAVLILGGLLRSPLLPDGVYYGQWTPELGRTRAYAGRILSAHIGEVSVPNQRLEGSDRLREQLLRGDPLVIVAVADRRPRRGSLLFSIHDDEEREVVSLVVEGYDLLASSGSYAGALRLEPPVARFPGVLRDIEQADTFRLSFSLPESSAAVLVNGQERTASRLYSAGEGWRLLIDGDGSPNGLGALVSLLWLVGLAVPVGYLARSSTPLLLIGVCLVYAAVGAAFLIGMRSLPLAESLAPAGGAIVGNFLARRSTAPGIATSGGPAERLQPRRRSTPPSPAASG